MDTQDTAAYYVETRVMGFPQGTTGPFASAELAERAATLARIGATMSATHPAIDFVVVADVQF